MSQLPSFINLSRTLTRLKHQNNKKVTCRLAIQAFHSSQSISRTSSFWDWLSPINLIQPKTDVEILKEYKDLCAQRIQYPYLKPPLDHPTLSRLIQKHEHSDPARTMSLYEDLEKVWKYLPTEQDTLCYLSASLTEGKDLQSLEKQKIPLLERCRSYRQALKLVQNPKTEAELAHLLRLAIKEGLNDEQERWLNQVKTSNLQIGLLFHGALLTINNQSLQYVRNQLENGQQLNYWIEINLVERLSIRQDDRIDLWDVLAQLCRRASRQKAMNLVEHVITSLGSSLKTVDEVVDFADRLRETTGVDIFHQDPGRLAGRLFQSTSALQTFDQCWKWHQLVKARAGTVWGSCLISTLGFQDDLLLQPDRMNELWTEFQSAAHAGSLSWSDLSPCSISFLHLAIRSNRPELAQTVLKEVVSGSQRQKDQGLKSEVLYELLEPLLSISQNRDQAFWFYEQLVQLGRPSRGFFEHFLRLYLYSCESHRPNERPHALTMQKLMAILEHMSQASVTPDIQTYSILLNHFSTIVRANPRNLSTRLQLERIHTLIKLDVNLEPDSQLLHQLLKAFSYNGLYSKAWMIWDRLSTEEPLREGMTNASVATMFDLAGYESERHGDGRLNRRAIDAWEKLRGQQNVKEMAARQLRWPKCFLNKNVWDSWVECLCRSRRVDEAIKVVFEEMAVAGNLVDERTLSILLRFGRREDELEKQQRNFGYAKKEDFLQKIQQMIRSNHPNLWNLVKEQGLTANEIEKNKSHLVLNKA
ncbi:hypothetical protein O181_006763 [Austropuccinia psidii MF-1]|uniref:Uncharacterized protein n=1 Tax=Austropuccinia psidii MF-1 TaxID=1389203 RepID=A0A9Q3GGW7_9BASI|nr:hypothetical protein [Austropuccinia psidii MF-1]